MRAWRLTAHLGVAATLLLNALAAPKAADVPWHVAAPAVWAVLVELTARQVLADFDTTCRPATGRITVALWITSPVESIQTRLLMLRAGITDAKTARIAVGIHAAARESLRLALPDRHGRRVRKIITRQLRAGSLPPSAILSPLGWADTNSPIPDLTPEAILKITLRGVLDASADRTSPENLSHRSADNETAISGSSLRRAALSAAVSIVRKRPQISGPQLRAELKNRGWSVSDRTATRILADAQLSYQQGVEQGPRRKVT